MLVEERIYLAHPGKMGEFLKIYEAEALPLQLKYLENMVGFFTSEIGTLNQIVHMWKYESLDDRAARRARMAADPAFPAYLAKATPLLAKMENRILIPTSFSALR
ncbi:MAG: NIPSNAP family protein [Flavobacteriaceae bacterium]